MSSKPLYSIGNSCYEDKALMVALPKKAREQAEKYDRPKSREKRGNKNE
jgi:hypothetical protein